MSSITQDQQARINGFEVWIDRSGRQVLANPNDETLRKRVNGPHHDAQWAWYLLGTDVPQAEVRRQHLAEAQPESRFLS